VLVEIIHRFPWLRHVFADGGYAGDKLRQALRKIGTAKWTIEIIKRSDTAKGFEVVPRRWVVERTLAWLSRTDVSPRTSNKPSPRQPPGCSSHQSSSSHAASQENEITQDNFESDSKRA